MTKVTLDIDAFKALASDTRLEILKTLDGKNMSLSEISRATSLNKATLHEHLLKLHQAGLIKRKERQGHKWVYYKLSWKGESLLHPENARIVIMFAASFVAMIAACIQFFNYVKSSVFLTNSNPYMSIPEADDALGNNWIQSNNTTIDPFPTINKTYDITRGSNALEEFGGSTVQEVIHDPIFLYIAIVCMIIFCIIFTVSIWRYKLNKKQKI